MPEENKVESSTKKIFRKKSIGRRIRESFFSGDSLETVIGYLLTDVAMPSFKELMLDLANRGLEKLMYGDDVPRSFDKNKKGTGSYFQYSSISSNKSSRSQQSSHSRTRPSTYLEEDLYLEGPDAYQNALLVRDIIIELILKYDKASIADLLNELKNIYPDQNFDSHGYADTYYGWTDFSGSKVVRVKGGAVLELPKCEQLD